MSSHSDVWAIILAGGNGSRMSPLTTDERGTTTPKQYCSLAGDRSLLGAAIDRATDLTDCSRVIVVVAASHRRWWKRELADLDPGNVVVQPRERGTACGVLLPLTSIRRRDPSATVFVMPSDHYFEDEVTVEVAQSRAIDHASRLSDALIVLGMQPDAPIPDYGWITPSASRDGELRRVRSFVEKPGPAEALRLMAGGGLWNTMLFAARAGALMQVYERTVPWLTARFSAAFASEGWQQRNSVLPRLYDRLPSVDLSSQVFQIASDMMRVLTVPMCGWTDLGTPARVVDCLRKSDRLVGVSRSKSSDRGQPLDLSRLVAAAGDNRGLARPTLRKADR